ncbi:hypothetical protein [Sphingomonas sp. SRS2]|uniref:hypothetical protein n=1 Tax=Sphingomonas sp. SRS2 TaxID=133190 RepID=UPI00061841FB|nr:hypothetical protein [Sphingomonas sp. SRS2]KKC25821.1 hypothetical protein WP12_12260 [Sphingomonas sp. SRS2]
MEKAKEALDTLFDAGRVIERAAIVKWLRNEAAVYAFARKWRLSVALEKQADAIQRLDHLNPAAGE